MACSKLFSGDLPEISAQIIQNLRNNVNILYSLALVNRFWCRLAIPLLWEDPFSTTYRKNSIFHFLDTYFLFLNENNKSKMKEIKSYKFNHPSLHKPLFNYPSLIKTLNLLRIQIHVANWLDNINNTTTVVPLTFTSYLPYEYKRALERIQGETTVVPVLFKIFIENNASPNNLNMSIKNYYTAQLFYGIYDMVLNSSKFISEIEIFTVESYYMIQSLDKSFQTFLSTLPSLLTSIKHIDINLIYNDSELNRILTNIIQSQPQLSSIRTKVVDITLLNLLKHCSNTLTSINFSSCTFFNTVRYDTFSHLTKLESLQFNYCHGLKSKSNIIQPLLSITTQLKIKTFVFADRTLAKSTNKKNQKIILFQLLIQKIGPYLENLVLDICEDELRRKLFDAVIEFCGKIKFLHLGSIVSTDFPQLSKMIYTFDNQLKYLTLENKFYIDYLRTNDNHEEMLKTSSVILKELSKSLPLSLYYLDLKLVINPSDLQVFFENCKQIELKKLLIRNTNKNNIDTTLRIIRDFVKEKNLEFLAYSIENIFSFDHKSLEKLVEETQSFVKMKIYDDLTVKVSNIDGNLING